MIQTNWRKTSLRPKKAKTAENPENRLFYATHILFGGPKGAGVK